MTVALTTRTPRPAMGDPATATRTPRPAMGDPATATRTPRPATSDTATAGRPSFRSALDGARDITPMVIGVIPFGLAIGASIGSTSVGTAEGLASGPMILAGAAQLSTLRLLDSGTAAFVVILSALMINARLLLYSASLARWFSSEPLRRRLVLAVPVIDQLHFTCTPRFEQGDLDAAGRRWYYTGAASWLAGAWTASQVVAAIGGARLPSWLGLELAAPLALAGLLAKSLSGRRTIVAATVAATVNVAAVGLPFNSAVLVATLIALVVAAVAPVERARDVGAGS
jgi:predicted branched-subunit amino acid permease